LSDTNLLINLSGYAGATYQAPALTNLVDRFLWDAPLPGTNGPMQLILPIIPWGQAFFRLNAAN